MTYETYMSRFLEWPRKYQVIGLLTLVGTTQMILYWLLYPAKQNELATIIQRVNQLRSEVSTRSMSLNHRENLLTEIESKAKQSLGDYYFPGRNSDLQTELLTSIHRYASELSLNLHQTKWKEPEINELNTRFTLYVDLSGEFRSIGEFFYFMESNRKVLSIEHIGLFRSEKVTDQIRLQIRVSAYLLNNNWKHRITGSFPDIGLQDLYNFKQEYRRESDLTELKLDRNPFKLDQHNDEPAISSQTCPVIIYSESPNPLLNFELDELLLKGFFDTKHIRYALIQTPNGGVIAVSKGDLLGNERGYVLSVNQKDLLIYTSAGECKFQRAVYWPQERYDN